MDKKVELLRRFDVAVNRYWKMWYALTDEQRERFETETLTVHAIWATTVIEGSELTEDETARVLRGEVMPKWLEISSREVINIKRGRKYVDEHLADGLSHLLIKSLHVFVVHGVKDEIAGKYRDVGVRVGRCPVMVDWKNVTTEIDALIRWYELQSNVLHPLELATEFHARFEIIHPFRDGNGRTGRLLFDWMMLKNGKPSLVLSMDDIEDYYNGIKFVAQCRGYLRLMEFFVVCYEKLTDRLERFE